VKGAANLYTYTKECNKYDLTAAAQCLSLAHHNDWSRWFAISSPPPIRYPSFNFIGGVAEKYITKLGCEKYFLKGDILSATVKRLLEQTPPVLNILPYKLKLKNWTKKSQNMMVLAQQAKWFWLRIFAHFA